MKSICIFLLLFLLSSCATVQHSRIPELVAGGPATAESVVQQSRRECGKRYVLANWQFVHSINFVMASGQGTTLVGVTVLDGQRLKTVLMSVEGFVFFEAVQDGRAEPQVNRALPPFDNTAFANGLLDDVRAIFPRPVQTEPLVARSVAGELLCRYQGNEGRQVDIVPLAGGVLLARIYGADGQLIKTISEEGFSPVAGENIPQNIQLTVPGLRGYTLKMTLLSADKIEQKTPKP